MGVSVAPGRGGGGVVSGETPQHRAGAGFARRLQRVRALKEARRVRAPATRHGAAKEDAMTDLLHAQSGEAPAATDANGAQSAEAQTHQAEAQPQQDEKRRHHRLTMPAEVPK